MLWVESTLDASRQGCGVREGWMPITIVHLNTLKMFTYPVFLAKNRVVKHFRTMYG